MITYILAFILALSIFQEVRFFLIKRRIKGSPEIKKGMEAFLLKGGKKGILMIHGFSSSPHELITLGKQLNRKGFTVYAPLLTGHGTTPEHMAVAKWHQWIGEAEEGLGLLNTMCNEIWVMGNSMGGNIALHIASKNKKIKGLICMSTPIKFKMRFEFLKYIVPILRRIKIFQRKTYSKAYLKRFKKFRATSYRMIPLISLVHLQKIIKTSVKSLPEISAPILIIQARPDSILDEKSAQYIYSNVASEKKQIIWVGSTYHNIIVDEGKKKVKIFKAIRGFIDETK